MKNKIKCKCKVYIAGKLRTKEERDFIEKIASLCEELGLETFVPHRDVGLCKGIKDVEKIFRGDIINGFKNCKLIIAVLDGLHVGAGTSWELGYAYANNIPAIGIKTDEPFENALDELSAIIISSMKIVSNLDELKREIKKINLKV